MRVLLMVTFGCVAGTLSVLVLDGLAYEAGLFSHPAYPAIWSVITGNPAISSRP